LAPLLIGILVTIALVFVAYPLINPRKYKYYLDDLLGSSEEKKSAYLQQKRAIVYDNIKDLDFEYAMGKLADADYERLRNTLMEEAEEIVGEIDKAQIAREIDELIESEVLKRRRIK
jgi:hypothetical protein